MASPSSTRSLRLRHRGAVLRELLQNGTTTRSHLADSLVLSPATITNVVNDLATEGLVTEVGLEPSAGGRPKARIAVVPEAVHFVGAVVSERSVTAQVFDASLTARGTATLEADSKVTGPQQLPILLADALAAARSAAGNPHVHAIGLGLPGIVEDGASQQSLELFATGRRWPADLLTGFAASQTVPVLAENSGKLAAMAEMWSGAARGIQHGAVALLGRGTGLGIITDGRLLRGHASNAGEWGHTKIAIGGPQCVCGAHGCLNAFIGATALAKTWRARGGRPPADDVSAALKLLDRADVADPIAADIVTDMSEALAVGISNLVNLLNPTDIVLAGPIGQRLSDARLNQIETHTRALALRRPGEQFRIIRGAAKGDGVALGAALLGVNHLLANPRRSSETHQDG